jgi:RNA polymerase sigma-70 factor (ECF subfamily)
VSEERVAAPDEGRGARDAALVEASRAGDRSAFSDLVRLYTNAVRTIARERVDDPDSVDDVVQDTFLNAWKSIDHLREPREFRRWLNAIARNAATEVLRRRMRERPVSDREGGLAEVESLELGPEQCAELGDLTSLVRGCVFGLNVHDAVVVMMITAFGFSSADVGAAVGISGGAAKVTAHRVRRRLRGALGFVVLQRSKTSTCPAFLELCNSDQVAAIRHIESCPTCQDDASGEVQLFESETDDPDSFGPEGLDE